MPCLKIHVVRRILGWIAKNKAPFSVSAQMLPLWAEELVGRGWPGSACLHTFSGMHQT